MILKFVCLFLLIFSQAFGNEDVLEEDQYNSYAEIIRTGSKTVKFSELENKKLFVDALWDAVHAYDDSTYLDRLRDLNLASLKPADQLRVELLLQWPMKGTLSLHLLSRYQEGLRARSLSARDVTTVMAYEEFTTNAKILFPEIQSNYPIYYDRFNSTQKAFRPKNKQEIKDLFFNTPDISDYRGGKYKQGVRLFMFCRYTRLYKCLLLMKDQNNQPVYLEDGKTLWSHPALGMSRLRRPSWVRNGNTPEGVYTIDGVMPYPTKKKIFGKYRRMIINFLPRSTDEKTNKSFLPDSAHGANWWKSAVVARDVGRNLLRIHGSGVKRSRPRDPFHPLRPTLGCVMQRELKFGRVTYKDQRKLLDRVMVAQGMEPVYKNEVNIRGTLYVIEMDKTRKSVTYDEIVKKYLEL